jgi:hypothetical protein
MPTFQDDLAFLKSHTEIHVLSDGKGREVAVAPQLQGRIFTSTLDGPKGASHGWINRDFITAGKLHSHFNPYGGEDRFWLGPEGGQFSLYFAPGAPFDLEHSYVPAPFDKEPFTAVEKGPRHVAFLKEMRLLNYAGFTFQAELDRRVHLLEQERSFGQLGLSAQGLWSVGFESVNRLTNKGNQSWKKNTGLLSIWILGMFQPSDRSTVVIPFQGGDEKDLGPKVNDSYFGKVPGDRLKVKEDVLFFRADGKWRCKIGLLPSRAKPILGSWDAQNGILTVVRYTLPEPKGSYVNSMWEIQKDPYSGDVVNSYNDGPPEPGQKSLGLFYELETSSPAAALSPGDHITHVHQTFHFAGERQALDRAALQLLGASLGDIEEALS